MADQNQNMQSQNEQPTKISVSDQEWLDAVKMGANQGVFLDYPPEKLKKIDAKARAIYEKAGQDYISFIKSTEKFEPVVEEDPSLGEQVVKGIKGVPDTVKMIVDNPLLVGENALRGYARSFNPAPVFGGDQVTLESMEALAGYPIVRGAEMFGRMFLDEDQRVPYTPLIQMIDEQEEFNRQLSAKAPGIQEGIETASIVAGLGATGVGLYKGAKAATKWAKEGGPKFVRQFISKRKASKAAKMTEELRDDVENLSVAVKKNGSLTDTIINEPQEVESFLKNADDYAYQNFADDLLEEFDAMETNLGVSVRKYKDAAYKDNETLIEVPEEILQVVSDIRARTTIQGKSVLPGNINKELERWEQIAATGKMTPRDAIILDNLLVDIVKFGDEAKTIGKTPVKEINPQLLQLRALNKNALRNSSPDASAWTQADDQYSQFVTRKQKLGNLVKNEKGVDRLVSTILNESKSRDRRNLEEMLDYANALDPEMRGSQEFIRQVRQLKAAKGIKDIQTESNRPQQQMLMNFIQKHKEEAMRRREKQLSIAKPVVGGVLGSVFDAFAGGGGKGTGIGAIGGLVKTSFDDMLINAAGAAGEKAAIAKANPANILKRAKDIKKLSKEARALAGDLEQIYNAYGNEGIITALDIVAATPFAIELMEYVQTQPKQKQEAQIKVPAKKTEPTLNINVDLGTIERRRQRQGVQ